MDPDALLEGSEGAIAAGRVAVGDLLVTNSGTRIPVVRVLRVETQSHPEREARLGWPVRIVAGAMGHGSPRADITVPAGTFCFINPTDDTPIPVSELVNGATVQRMEPDVRTWCGIVLQLSGSGHIALVASGLVLAGQKLETIDASEAALLSAAAPRVPRREQAFDLPSLACHAVLRRQLADHALALGYTQIADPDIRLLVGGHALIPNYESATCRFRLPPPDLLSERGKVVLRSRQGIPADFLGEQDERRLGVAVAQILADGRRISLIHWTLGQGWHGAEAGWRWTDGAAAFLLPPRTRVLQIEIANTLLAYPLPQRDTLPVVDEAYR